MNYVVMISLLISMIFDIKSQKIPTIWLWCSIGIVMVYRIIISLRGDDTWNSFILALLPGVFLLIFAKISNQIGKGDGLLILITGCYFSCNQHAEVLFISFFLAAIYSMGIMLIKRDYKNRRIAFAPFLFVASVVIMYL